MNAIKIDTAGNITEVKDTSLKGLQTAVGGYIEIVYLKIKPYEHKEHKYDVMLVDEEGLLKKLPFNPTGRQIYVDNTQHNDNPIVGDIVLTTKKALN